MAQGVNEFTNTQFGGRAFPNLGVTTRERLQNYLTEFFNKPGTKGFEDPKRPGCFTFYNPNDNTIVFFDKSNKDFGTIFRPDDAEKFYKAKLNTAVSGSGIKLAELEKTTPKQIQKLTSKFTDEISVSRGLLNDFGQQLGKAEQRIPAHANGATLYAPEPHVNGVPHSNRTTYIPVQLNSEAEIAEDLTRAGKLMAGLKGGAKIGGHVLKGAGLVVLVAVVSELASKAETATREGKMTPKQFEHYRRILDGTLITSVDPTIIVGEEALQKHFDEWAKKENLPESLCAELRPQTLLSSLGFKQKSEHQVRMEAFIDRLPNHPTAETTRLGLNNLIDIKQQIKQEAFELGVEKIRKPLHCCPVN